MDQQQISQSLKRPAKMQGGNPKQQVSNVDTSPHLVPVDMDEPGWDSTRLDPVLVKIKQNKLDQQILHQVKPGESRAADKQSIPAVSTLSDNSRKSEMRLRNSSHQFMQLADQLMTQQLQHQQESSEVAAAMHDANGYNIVNSKSSKFLPVAKNRDGVIKLKSGKNVTQPSKHQTSERLKMSNSVKNIIAREHLRDEKLATRLKKINDKQAERIRQIESQELRNQQDELKKMVQRTNSQTEISILNKPKSNQDLSSMINKVTERISLPGTRDKNQNGPGAHKSQRQSLGGSYIPQINNVEKDQKFFSNRKDYFNSKSQSSQMMHADSVLARNESIGVTQKQHNDTTTADHSISQISNLHKGANTSTMSAWGTQAARQLAVKDRTDVSFLQEKATLLYSQNSSKKLPMDPTQGVLLSQSQLTSGNEGRDDYLQIALGLRQIGKSIMDMPKTLDDLRLLSREYMKNLGVTDDIMDEQVYLQYIEDHLRAQERNTAQVDNSRAANTALSPIRNLADFYQRKLNKIQVQADSLTKGMTSRSPRRRNVTSKNQTLIDIDTMTAVDLEKLETSPPKINPRRKNMKVISNKAMTQFGPEAFNINPDDLDTGSATRLKQTKNLQSSVPSSLSKAESQPVFPTLDRDTQPVDNSMTPKSKVTKSGQHHRHNSKTKAGHSRTTDRRKLLNSLNDLADQLTRPSITGEDKQPQWIQQNLKEEAAKHGLSQSNLGKPSSRQDAVLLAKWFKGIIDTIELEFQKSKMQQAKSAKRRPFQTQKSHESEVQQTDSFLLLQIAHNIAIKEITRQVSVQCIERGILLKTIFDSYVRMVDLIFVDSFAQRKLLTQKFAMVCEKQVFFHTEQIETKDATINEKDFKIAALRNELEIAKQKEAEFKLTNKKLTQISYRSQAAEEESKRVQLALQRQNKFLEERIAKILEHLEPDKALVLKKETRRALHKIQNQADIDHEQAINKRKQNLDGDTGTQAELYQVAGECIKTVEKGTDMDDHQQHLERQNGGPLTQELIMQTSLYHEDASNSEFDLYEVGAIKNAHTMIDPQWRRETRPKRIRPKSAVDKEVKKLDKQMKHMDGASFDTSSHHTIDYLVDAKSTESYTIGQDGAYVHIRKQRPMRRSLSAGNFNWNLLVKRIDAKFEAEAKENEKLNSGLALSKLKEILGQSLLTRIRDEIPELYAHLMDHLKQKKQISFAFCRNLLDAYNINLEDELKLQMQIHGRKFKQLTLEEEAEQQNLLDDSNENDVTENGGTLDLTKISDVLAGGNKDTLAKAGKGFAKAKSKDSMYKFVEWNFQKRKQAPKRERKDHPSNTIVTKLMDKFNKGKEIKDMMPVKTAVRYIYNIYMGKAQEFAQEKQALKKAKAESLSTKNESKFSPRQSMAAFADATANLQINADADEGMHSRASVPRGMKKHVSQQQSKATAERSSEQKQAEESAMNKTGASNLKAKESDETNLVEWSYDYFNNRYGLKNVADKKFSQFIGSVIKYKDKYPRFRLFGRFLGLFDELTEHDLKLYVDLVHNMFKTVLNFQILEQDEVILLPTPRAIDYFRLSFITRLSNASMTSCIKIIKQKQMSVQKAHSEKHFHLNSYNEAVQLDDFAEFTILTTNQLQAEKLNNIQDLFMAADLAQNGVLLFNEFKTLYKLLCNQHSGDFQAQMQEIKTLFNEYAEPQKKGNEVVKVKSISYEKFEKLCLDKDVFTIRQQNSFINAATKKFLNVTDSDETFNKEFLKLNSNIDAIHLRLIEAIREVMDSKLVPDGDKQRYEDMVEQMAKAVMKPANRKVAFLTFKIVEETIKRACLKVQIDNLMPLSTDSIRQVKKSLTDITAIAVDKKLTGDAEQPSEQPT